MRISPYISAGRDIFKHWIFINLLPQSTNGFGEWNLTGTAAWSVGDGILRVATGAGINSEIDIGKTFLGPPLFTWDKERRVNFWVEVSEITSQEIIIVSGSQEDDQYVGFRIIDNALWGICKQIGIAEEAVFLQNIIAGSYCFSFVLTANTRVQFFVDGVYANELTASIPTGLADSNNPLELYITNTEAANKEIALFMLEFLQKK